jgi:hypothetical protein
LVLAVLAPIGGAVSKHLSGFHLRVGLGAYIRARCHHLLVGESTIREEVPPPLGHSWKGLRGKV